MGRELNSSLCAMGWLGLAPLQACRSLSGLRVMVVAQKPSSLVKS